MATINPSVGLVSGLNLQDIVTAMTSYQTQAVTNLQTTETTVKAQQTALDGLTANLVTLLGTTQSLKDSTTFQSFLTSSSDQSQITATTSSGVQAGSYQFQALRLAATEQYLSTGFVNSDTQAVSSGSSGTITVAAGGWLSSDTSLGDLNGGAGFRRGTVRVTDRSGASADIDLSGVSSVTDVLNAINSTSEISVNASVQGDKIVLTDTTGQSLTNLTVAEVKGGHAAQDLGIKSSVATNTLTGSTIYQATGAFTLSRLDDGNGLRTVSSLPSLKITLTDVSATQLAVDLNGTLTINDVVSKINNATGNSGKLTASLANGHLVLTDNTGGGGSQPLSVTDVNGSSVVRALGLSGTAAGNTLTGTQLTAGLNTVFLHNLRGGQGIDHLGTISLTDRSGTTATLDLSSAQSLTDVLDAINNARATDTTKLQITASIDAAGNGIQITDTSGSTVSNLIIADTGGSTAATQLGIAVNAAQTSLDSGSLNQRYVGEATSLSTYAAGGTAVTNGGITLTDSAGTQYNVVIDSSAKNVGDVLLRINAATSGKITAQLNSTGDGIELVDNAGGTGQVQVTEAGSTTASKLRLLGTGTTGIDGKSHLNGRSITTVSVTSSDTLTTLTNKINSAGGNFSASIIDDGTSFSPFRLQITSKQSGSRGRFIVSDGGLGLGVQESTRGENALLRVGSSSTGLVLSSTTNVFKAAATGLDVTAVSVGASSAQIAVSQDTTKIGSLVQNLVTNYNAFVSNEATQSKYDTTTNTAGPLQGQGVVLRVTTTLASLFAGSTFGTSSGGVQSLNVLGVTFNADSTISLDASKLQTALDNNSSAVTDFFTNATTGFAVKLKTTLDSYSDATTGQLSDQSNALQDTITGTEQRITDLNNQINSRKATLLQKFYNMETLLSSLQSQQTVISKITNLYTLNSTSSSTSG